jgi:hypothetical protein
MLYYYKQRDGKHQSTLDLVGVQEVRWDGEGTVTERGYYIVLWDQPRGLVVSVSDYLS